MVYAFSILEAKDTSPQLSSQFNLHKKKTIKKKIQKTLIILEGNCNLHNWVQCPGSSLKVMPVRSIKDLLAWFLQFLVCTSPFSFFEKIRPRFGMRHYELMSNTNRNQENSLSIILAIEFSKEFKIRSKSIFNQDIYHNFQRTQAISLNIPLGKSNKISTICIYLDVYRGVSSIQYEM